MCLINTKHVCHQPSRTHIMIGKSQEHKPFPVFTSVSLHFLLFGHKITILLNITACDLLGNVTETDSFHSICFFLHSSCFSYIFFFLFQSPGCRFSSHKIQKYLLFFQFPHIINLSVLFFFISNSPDCAAHSSWAALRAARLWCFSSCSSDWSVSCRVSSKPPLSVHSF